MDVGSLVEAQLSPMFGVYDWPLAENTSKIEIRVGKKFLAQTYVAIEMFLVIEGHRKSRIIQESSYTWRCQKHTKTGTLRHRRS